MSELVVSCEPSVNYTDIKFESDWTVSFYSIAQLPSLLASILTPILCKNELMIAVQHLVCFMFKFGTVLFNLYRLVGLTQV